MFELSIALKYLIPRKKQLSVTLIAGMSLAVISMVVWLLLVFLSVTEGMEKTWLGKLTDLNAPLKINPKQAYFSSYYHQIDSMSSASGFSAKTVGEKLLAASSDPYNPDEDPELPSFFPRPDPDANGILVDPVKSLASILTKMQQKKTGFIFQDYEMSGAMLKLQMLRGRPFAPFGEGRESLNFLTQVSYLATPPRSPKILAPLLAPKTAGDINHLFFLAGYRSEGNLSDEAPDIRFSSLEFSKNISPLLELVSIKTMKTSYPSFRLPVRLLPENTPFSAYALFGGETYIEGLITNSKKLQLPIPGGTRLEKGTLLKKDGLIKFSFDRKEINLPSDAFLTLDDSIVFESKIDIKSVQRAKRISDIIVEAEGNIQGKPLKGTLPWVNLEIDSFAINENSSVSPPWAYADSKEEMLLPVTPSKEVGILLPKGFRDSGVLLGDRGFLSYSSSTASAMQELRTPVFVAGFYDPGVLSVGSKCLLVPNEVTRSINSSNASFSFDKISTNGFQVWINDLSKVDATKKEIERKIEEAGLSSYWQVTSFKEYDFAKDLLQQFRSDKYLFALVGIIILIVACCNIVSFLILLVNDKKKEIAILESMGASKKSIACIFGACGIVIGTIGCAVGILAAAVTLRNIDTIVKILSVLQGHDAFSQTFYGSRLPDTLSRGSAVFLLIATPILSVLAGLIPALKACKLNPSIVLRSES